MSSAFERLQKLAEEKRLKEKAEKPLLEIISVETPEKVEVVSAPSARRVPRAVSAHRTDFPIAPEKDFTKVANSIVRQIPIGVFIGKSKQMYDYLYSLTRGAIKPTRLIRISKKGLMRGSGIKSTHTFYNNVRHLEAIGLIITTRIDGEKGGNSYEVILPEEINGGLEQLAHLAQAEQLTQATQKPPVVVNAETALPALGSGLTNTGTLDTSKTLFKDNIKTDDESAAALFSDFIEKFQAAATKLTGAQLSKYEREKWGRLADLLVLELETASRRASNPVSSVPAFLTKVLSSKLLNQKPVEKTSPSKSKAKPDTVGKQYPEPDGADDDIKPLDDESKEAAVIFLQEFKDDKEFLNDYKKWYTEEDWNWIIKELAIKN
jgi:hypothetical protein